jgi:predicted regulator of amino acid metabolism with ACT domain
VEKNCYAVIMCACKLQHYFEAHTIRVLTDQPLHDIFSNWDSIRRISKWAMKLSEHVVDFEKRNTIKYQILADFVAEWTKLGSATDGVVPESPWLVYYEGPWGQHGLAQLPY